MIERAIAYTESLSQGREGQIVVILDFRNLKYLCARSCKVMKHLIWILKKQSPLSSSTIEEPHHNRHTILDARYL